MPTEQKDLIFNELSLICDPQNIYHAKELLKKLLETYRQIRKVCNPDDKANHFAKLRFDRNRESLKDLKICQNYSIQDCLNALDRDSRMLFFSIACHPYIEDEDENEDENIVNRYVQANYTLKSSIVPNIEPTGLAAAYLYDTLALSLDSHNIWRASSIELTEKIGEKIASVSVKHMSTPGDISAYQQWIQDNCPITLIKTTTLPQNKAINLRDDHGKDILKAFAKELLQSEYVEKVINSLPFNPKVKKFIKNVTPDGKIEIVLTWTDQGHGLVIQTTGRTQQKTQDIADIIEREYKKST